MPEQRSHFCCNTAPTSNMGFTTPGTQATSCRNRVLVLASGCGRADWQRNSANAVDATFARSYRPAQAGGKITDVCKRQRSSQIWIGEQTAARQITGTRPATKERRQARSAVPNPPPWRPEKCRTLILTRPAGEYGNVLYNFRNTAKIAAHQANSDKLPLKNDGGCWCM